jgi:hypothetical protein
MLGSVFRANRRWIASTYALLCVEFVAFSGLPYLLGRTIDGLLAGDRRYFGVYLSCSLAAFVLGVTRRRLDTRVFTGVWVGKSLESIRRLAARGVSKSYILSRVGLVGTYGNFFETTVPATVAAVVDLVVSFVMVWMVVPTTAYVVGLEALVAVGSTYVFSFFIQRVERETQFVRERADARIVADDLSHIEADYAHLRRKYVRRSDIDAACWGFVDLLKIAADAIALFALVRWAAGQATPPVGTMMATLMYTAKLFEKAGFLSSYFNHLKQIQMVDDILAKADGSELILDANEYARA